MMGLIKVSEWIDINFHIICKIVTYWRNGKTVKKKGTPKNKVFHMFSGWKRGLSIFILFFLLRQSIKKRNTTFAKKNQFLCQTYIVGYHFTIEPKELGSENPGCRTGRIAFRSFIDSDLGIVAFHSKDLWNENILDDLFILKSPEFTISYTVEEIDQVNWNEEWKRISNP